ncbi:TauD/TfdA family dioxygenase [Burkholderia cepacia]|uniref:TauD/TfdA family dioxygenase n=1 Tax=Burkholderia cepacia TaxID=292 RepID=UPI002AB773D8|nr:TauD/TfdA family dioxygenase [Burkholderia cepacia]
MRDTESNNEQNSISMIDVHEISETWKDVDPFENFQKFCYAGKVIGEIFKPHLKAEIQRLRAGSLNRSHLCISDAPIDDNLPATPLNSRRQLLKKTYKSELALAAISLQLGEIFCYPEQSDGEIVHNICPVKGKEKIPVGENSLNVLAFHNDGASHIVPPDFVLLSCLRSPKNPPATLVSDVREIVLSLSDHVVQTLSEPRFIIKEDSELSLDSHLTKKTAILYFDDDTLSRVSYDLDSVQPTDTESASALLQFERSLHQFATEITLRAGEILVIDNRISVHARTSFTPAFDGTDRWLQSTYVKQKFHPSDFRSINLSPNFHADQR